MSVRRVPVVEGEYFPAYVVWELTLRCDQPCAHCGSRAGARRPSELDTGEALGVVQQLAEMRAREVVLIGGEAYLHDGFLEIIRALKSAGIRPTMTTGGRGITPDLAAKMKEAGLRSVSVSVDGLRPALGVVLFAAALGVLSKAGVDVPLVALVGLPIAVCIGAYALHRSRASEKALLT